MIHFGNEYLVVGWRGTPKAARIDETLRALERVFAAVVAGLSAA